MMMRAILPLIFAVACCGVAQADALEEQAKHDPALAEAIKDAKEHGQYGHAYQASQRDIDKAEAYNSQRDELNLRRMGMTSDTARKGMWALGHKPHSACASYIRQLTADAMGGAEAFAQSDQMLIGAIERSGTCELKNLD